MAEALATTMAHSAATAPGKQTCQEYKVTYIEKIAEKSWEAEMLIRGEGASQPQRIEDAIIPPRGRDTISYLTNS